MWRKNWFDVGVYFEADKGDGNGAGGTAGDKTPPPQKDEAKFTQADLDRLIGERAKRAEEAAVTNLLKSLDFEKVDDLSALVKQTREKQQSELTELQKAQKQIETLAAKASEADKAKLEALAQANEKLMRAAVLSEATKPEYGFDPKAVKDVWMFVDKSKIKPKEGTEDFEGITAALKELAKDREYLTLKARPQGTPRPAAIRPGADHSNAPETSRKNLLS